MLPHNSSDRKFWMSEAKIPSILLRSSLFAVLWWMLAEGNHEGWMLGAVAIGLATWTSLVWLPPSKERLSLRGLVGFVAFFVWHSVRGGAQVAWMATRSKVDLQPYLLELPITLPAGAPRILLINALGLMPGTLSVEVKNTTLLIHALDDRQPILAETRALEAAIGRLFGVQS